MYISKRIMTPILILFIAISYPLIVNAKDEAGSGPNPYRDCGIGAALFDETHWAAVTSNIIWDVGTTAVTSATMSPETCSGRGAKAAKFINDTYINIVEDTARGQGDHITTLLEIYGCEAQAHSDVIVAIRSNVGEVINADNYAGLSLIEKSEHYYSIINTEIETNFVDSCTT